MSVKSRIAKITAASALTVGIVGLGAGIASAQPAQQPAPQQQQQQNDQRPQNDSNRNDQDRNNQDRHDQDRHDQNRQPAGHGFWFFGTWIPLP
ncbi:hypothetical protein AB0L57_30250 [Nocardia sp. NPDC052254]|uniref:hypothetical protein n=1 Tax=Nocardia sp. NPDC052254 TaxID=3155681 RepID=UPI003414FF12